MKSIPRLAAAAVVTAALLSACGDDAPSDEPTTTTSAPSPTPSATLEGASTDEVSEESDAFGQLVAVRVGEHSGFDRVVFEFAEDVPGYTVSYADLPMAEDGSGEPVDLPAADAAVKIVFTPASGFDMDVGKATYKGPKSITNDKTVEITAVADAGDFESVLSWAVGLRHEVPFKVTKLDKPARLVVDFQAG